MLEAVLSQSQKDASSDDLAKHFLCRKISTAEEYVALIEAAGIEVEQLVNAIKYVVPTWHICLRRIKRFSSLRHMAPASLRALAVGLDVILDAYLSSEQRYTIIAARSRKSRIWDERDAELCCVDTRPLTRKNSLAILFIAGPAKLESNPHEKTTLSAIVIADLTLFSPGQGENN